MKDENNNFIVRVDKSKGKSIYFVFAITSLSFFILGLIIYNFVFSPFKNDVESIKSYQRIGLIAFCVITFLLIIYFIFKYIDYNRIFELKIDISSQKVIQHQVYPKLKEIWTLSFSEITEILYYEKNAWGAHNPSKIPHKMTHYVLISRKDGVNFAIFNGDFRTECIDFIKIISRILDKPIKL